MIMSPGLKIGNRGKEKSGSQVINSTKNVEKCVKIPAVREAWFSLQSTVRERGHQEKSLGSQNETNRTRRAWTRL